MSVSRPPERRWVSSSERLGRMNLKDKQRGSPGDRSLQKNCHWFSRNRSCSLCHHRPHFNGLIAQTISVQILVALFQQHFHAIVRSGGTIVYGFCRLQTLPCLRTIKLTSLLPINRHIPSENSKFWVSGYLFLCYDATVNAVDNAINPGSATRRLSKYISEFVEMFS